MKVAFDLQTLIVIGIIIFIWWLLVHLDRKANPRRIASVKIPPKPIFIVGIIDQWRDYCPMDKKSKLDELHTAISNLLPEYHCIAYFTNREYIFNCFYEKDFDEVKYEELKQMVINAIHDPPTPTEALK